MSTDHGVRTDLNVLLVKNGGLRKTDDAVLTKCTKSLTSRGARTNGSVNRQPVPNRMRNSLLQPQGYGNHEMQSNR